MSTITQQHLDRFKSYYRDLDDVQGLKLEDAHRIAKDGEIDWFNTSPEDFRKENEDDIPACYIAIGFVIFDAVCLGIGAWGLRPIAKPATIKNIASVIYTTSNREVTPAIELLISQLASEKSNFLTKAWNVVSLLIAIKNAGLMTAIWKAFKGGLTLYYAIIYGVQGLATITAAFATGGLALAAEVALVVVSAAYLVNDVVSAITICNLTARDPDAPPSFKKDPMVYKPNVSIRTFSGNYLTVVDNGGLGGPNAEPYIIHTDATTIGAWEKFTLVPIDPTKDTFALRTASGNYLTAVGGGGQGGPNMNFAPIHTDATQVGDWEQIVLIQQIEQGEETYALATTRGYFITAVNGGGMNGRGSIYDPLHTDASSIGNWETFTFSQIQYSENWIVSGSQRDGASRRILYRGWMISSDHDRIACAGP